MIRIRFAPGVHPPVDLIVQHGLVEVTSDAAVVAVESDKNDGRVRGAVQTLLRPIFADRWASGTTLFRIVSIETRSGCNHECRFCPVSSSLDPRPPGQLSLAVISGVADELAQLDFAGRIALFGNNEPLLDPRIESIVALFHARLPAANIRILSNGTIATVERVEALFDAGLTTLMINNYTDGQRLIRPVRELIESATVFRAADLRISVRRRDEVLTTRGGSAPNKVLADTDSGGFCALPFTDMHIAYTGDVNQCCFDALGQTSFGNVAETPIADIWADARLQRLRDGLLRSDRGCSEVCSRCDFDGFRDPDAPRDPPLTRGDLIGQTLEVHR